MTFLNTKYFFFMMSRKKCDVISNKLYESYFELILDSRLKGKSTQQHNERVRMGGEEIIKSLIHRCFDFCAYFFFLSLSRFRLVYVFR